jgi:hypothetical protein
VPNNSPADPHRSIGHSPQSLDVLAELRRGEPEPLPFIGEGRVSADADAECHPLTGQPVERRDLLGERENRVLRQ